MELNVSPQLVANNGIAAMRAAIASPERYALDHKVGRTAPYRSGSRKGWSKLKGPDGHVKHRRRFRR